MVRTSGGPGYYFVQNPAAIVGLQAVISGEYKAVDRFRGKIAADTGITSVYAGPRVVLSLGTISAEVAAEQVRHGVTAGRAEDEARGA